MEPTTCFRCAQVLESSQCSVCGEFLIPRCPHCGNTLLFEQVNHGQVTMLRCAICSNEMDFELTSLREGGLGRM
jgi:primosomal protein N'